MGSLQKLHCLQLKNKKMAFISLEKFKLSIFMYESCQVKEKLYLNVSINIIKDMKTIIVTHRSCLSGSLEKRNTHNIVSLFTFYCAYLNCNRRWRSVKNGRLQVPLTRITAIHEPQVRLNNADLRG